LLKVQAGAFVCHTILSHQQATSLFSFIPQACFDQAAIWTKAQSGLFSCHQLLSHQQIILPLLASQQVKNSQAAT